MILEVSWKNWDVGIVKCAKGPGEESTLFIN